MVSTYDINNDMVSAFLCNFSVASKRIVFCIRPETMKTGTLKLMFAHNLYMLLLFVDNRNPH